MKATACDLPGEVQDDMRRAMRLEWWNIGWTLSIIAVMGAVLGQSQTMKTAWTEDALGLIPPIVILVTMQLELKAKPSAKFPFGFARANGLGFFLAAVALAAVGALLLYDSVTTLIAAEHVTIASVRLFGHDLWLGWLMLAAQAYSLVPPLFIGRKELPLAERLNDKLLHTDALMNKANWLTGAAGFGGIIGLGMGFWWADSLAAAIISLDILHDGIGALRSSTAELIDGAPRALSDPALGEEAKKLQTELKRKYPGSTVRLRETGRVIRAEIDDAWPPQPCPEAGDHWPGDEDRKWRLAHVGFAPGKAVRTPAPRKKPDKG